MTRPWWAFWWGWPSLLVEFISGWITASAVVWVPLPAVWSYPWHTAMHYVMAQGLSVTYEEKFDPNKWNPTDVLQRTLGIVSGLLFWAWVLA